MAEWKMNKPIYSGELERAPVGRAIVTRGDGSTYELPNYPEFRKTVREQYKDDPDLERLAVRFAFEWQCEEIAYLRSVGMDDLADMVATDLDGVFIPTVRWLRDRVKDRLRSRQRPNESKYREGHREPIRERKGRLYKSRQGEFDALRLSRPFVVIDSEGQDYDGDDQEADTEHGTVLYKEHATYVWCASTDDQSKPVHVLTDPNSKGKDKRKLHVKTILDWLLSLPGKYDPIKINRSEQEGAIFVMFGSGYDIT
jgi:hypothetical protein